MWIGLLDEHKNAYHPRVVERVDADLVEWKLDYWKQGWLRLTNRSALKFKVHFAIERPGWYSFFRDIDDMETFYGRIPFARGEDQFGTYPDHLKEVGTITAIKAGDFFMLQPGHISMNLPGPSDPRLRP